MTVWILITKLCLFIQSKSIFIIFHLIFLCLSHPFSMWSYSCILYWALFVGFSSTTSNHVFFFFFFWYDYPSEFTNGRTTAQFNTKMVILCCCCENTQHIDDALACLPLILVRIHILIPMAEFSRWLVSVWFDHISPKRIQCNTYEYVHILCMPSFKIQWGALRERERDALAPINIDERSIHQQSTSKSCTIHTHTHISSPICG